ncbi:hypothetical protein [Streptomyces ipomoeae]|uniref:hypothetical protein n=1 Tax=Streptomyces ipomoeae TaxID=103232 RepID=UPI0011461D68|nr:hypothetical protein [Streptomyces ipomoeae]MDX2939161.1 hypothetical protein [Streptomyces ipomoeae]TQE31849.1 hypothetical protein SipoB123_00895 [Streptomyces ipomoeae]
MLEQELLLLAAAGGTAVVQAASTDAWVRFSRSMARWFGRGNDQRERAELERLDRTAAELEGAEAERARVRQEIVWQTRIEDLLASVEGDDRAQIAEELRSLLAQHTSGVGVSADNGGVAVGEGVSISADRGAAAAWRMRDVTVGNPPLPGPDQS